MEFLKGLAGRKTDRASLSFTFVVVLVALVFWKGVKDTAVGAAFAKNWAKILDCVNSPFSCSA
jgi:hypothetical protein